MAKEEIILEFKVEQGGAIAELEKTKKAILGLKDEQKDLNAAYKEGNVTYDEYISETVRLEQVQKKLTKTYSDLGHEVRGTKSFTDQFNQTLKGLAPNVSSSIEGFKGMAKSALAFIATPLGAVLAVVAGAIGFVVAALKRSEPVLDFFEDIVSKITTGIDFMLNNLEAIGKFIGNVLIGDFAGASKGLNNLAKGFSEAQTQAQLYLDITRELEDKSARVRIETAGLENQIKALIIASKNRNLSIQEQNKLLDEALKLEREMVAARAELADQEAIIGIKQIALKRDLKQLDEETFDAFVNRLIESEKLSKEEKDQIASLYEKKQESASAGLALEEKIQNARDAALDKELERIEKLKEAEEKQTEKRIEDAIKLQEIEFQKEQQKLRQQEIDDAEWEKYLERLELKIENDNIAASLKEIEAEQDEEHAAHKDDLNNLISSREQANLVKTAKLKTDLMKKGLTEKEAELQIAKMVEAQKLEATSSALGTAAGLFKKHTVAYKVAATAQATMDTYQNAVKAYQAGLDVGGPWGVALGAIFAGLAVAQGLKSVAEINGVAMAGGGKFTTKGPTLLLVGDNPGGRERVEVTPLSGKGTTRTFGRNGLAMAGGGSIDGSILAAASTNPIDTQFAMQDSVANMPPVYVSWTEKTDFENKMAFKAQLTEK